MTCAGRESKNTLWSHRNPVSRNHSKKLRHTSPSPTSSDAAPTLESFALFVAGSPPACDPRAALPDAVFRGMLERSVSPVRTPPRTCKGAVAPPGEQFTTTMSKARSARRGLFPERAMLRMKVWPAPLTTRSLSVASSELGECQCEEALESQIYLTMNIPRQTPGFEMHFTNQGDPSISSLLKR